MRNSHMRLQNQLRQLSSRMAIRDRRARNGRPTQPRRPARREAQRRAHVRALRLETPPNNRPNQEIAEPMPDAQPLPDLVPQNRRE